jgi:hypothetical protein
MFEDGSIHVIEGDKVEQLTQQHGQIVRLVSLPVRYAQMHLVTG